MVNPKGSVISGTTANTDAFGLPLDEVYHTGAASHAWQYGASTSLADALDLGRLSGSAFTILNRTAIIS